MTRWAAFCLAKRYDEAREAHEQVEMEINVLEIRAKKYRQASPFGSCETIALFDIDSDSTYMTISELYDIGSCTIGGP